MGQLEDFGAFRKARELFDLVVQDMAQLQEIPMCWRLAGQQVASADYEITGILTATLPTLRD
jgi:hypothetical protein